MMSSRRLYWIDVLNEQSRWTGKEELINWFAELAGRKVALLDGTIEGFEEALGYMRRQVANMHFAEPVDLLWLDTQLKTVSLGLLHHQGAQEGPDSKLPRFRARVKGLHDTDLLRAVKDTLLIQFAEYVGQQLDGVSVAVTRCSGVQNGLTVEAGKEMSVYRDDIEQVWRDEIELLSLAREAAPHLQRCRNYLAPGSSGSGVKARFCSDACRFSTSQLEKSLAKAITKLQPEPSYLAEKAPRYRRRQAKKGG